MRSERVARKELAWILANSLVEKALVTSARADEALAEVELLLLSGVLVVESRLLLRAKARLAADSLKEAQLGRARASLELKEAKAEARASKKERSRSLRRDLEVEMEMEMDDL